MLLRINVSALKSSDYSFIDVIGCYATCTKGIRGKITGVAKLPWGVAFVGFTKEGVAWSSRNPTVEFPDFEEEKPLGIIPQRIVKKDVGR